MAAVSTCETLDNMYQNKRRNIPEDSHLHVLIVWMSENAFCNILCLLESSVYVVVSLNSLQLCGCNEVADWLFS
jgi:hypothetical protein